MLFRHFTSFILLYTIVLALGGMPTAVGDTPANCTYEDILGEWTFSEGERGRNSDVDCSSFALENSESLHQLRITLRFPDVATDDQGRMGTWTLIYNQGFEVSINFRKYFAFSNWTQLEHSVVSRCHETKPGWSHDIFVRDWSCFVGRRSDGSRVEKVDRRERAFFLSNPEIESEYRFKNNRKMIDEINRGGNSWTAKAYERFEGMKRSDMLRMLGGVKSRIKNRPSPAPITRDHLNQVKYLPLSFDWRNVSGINYVSPVRDQGSCGSCYAFASMAMLEARHRIFSKNAVQPIFSPQDIVECSEYSQGCDGGFPYLIAGKYAEDFGVVEESCSPYQNPQPKNRTCGTKNNCKRYYATDYGYVGGYYGATNEALMKIELVKNGPFAVGIEVYEDFSTYQSGIYHHKSWMSNDFHTKWNPFQLTNHAVLVVGFGEDPKTREPYWTVKNSWGPQWGERGYFRIRRGTDECGIESLAVRATLITTY